MKCDSEGCTNEATVFETVIKSGKRVEKRLCDDCARKQGVAIQSHAPISELLTKFVMQQAAGAKAGEQEQAAPCPRCAMTWARFRQHGLLGCPSCYDSFEEALTPLIERAQEGGLRHTGKAPRRSEETLAAQRRLASLRRELDEAVVAEQFERAARLRDQLRQLGERPAPTPGPAKDPR